MIKTNKLQPHHSHFLFDIRMEHTCHRDISHVHWYSSVYAYLSGPFSQASPFAHTVQHMSCAVKQRQTPPEIAGFEYISYICLLPFLSHHSTLFSRRFKSGKTLIICVGVEEFDFYLMTALLCRGTGWQTTCSVAKKALYMCA
jgi:hypothetical protein